MANFGPSSGFLIVGARDISGDTFKLVESVEQKLVQSNALGDAWEAHKPVGVANVKLEASGGFYDDRVAGINEALQAQGAVQQLASWGLGGRAIGSEAKQISGLFAAVWKRIISRDDLTKANADYTVSGALLSGRVLHALNVAETSASGNTQGANAVDNGASSAFGLTADLHSLALTLGGYTSVTIKVRHSTDNSTYADLLTFTNVTSPQTTERQVFIGTVNRYLAISWLFNGAGSGQSITPYVAAAR